MANYFYYCEKHGEMILNLKMSEVKEEMECPLCKEKVKRIYSPNPSIWKCSGSFGKSNS